MRIRKYAWMHMYVCRTGGNKGSIFRMKKNHRNETMSRKAETNKSVKKIKTFNKMFLKNFSKFKIERENIARFFTWGH